MSRDPEGREAEFERVRALDPDVAAVLYQTMETKRQTHDQMMWQTPGLGLVAQSFLLVVALGPGSSWMARLLAAVLGVIAALSSIQLLLKHRKHEETDSFWLEQFARARDWPGASPKRVVEFAHAGLGHPWERQREGEATFPRAGRVLRHRASKRSSPYVWIAALALFATADVGVLVMALVHGLGGGSAL